MHTCTQPIIRVLFLLSIIYECGCPVIKLYDSSRYRHIIPVQCPPFTGQYTDMVTLHVNWKYYTIKAQTPLVRFVFVTSSLRDMRSIVMSRLRLSVCSSVHSHTLKTTLPNFTKFCACCLWSWLSPPVTILRYLMHFRFCGWRHVFKQWILRCVIINSSG